MSAFSWKTVTSRICTTNNRFKRSKSCVSQRIFVGKQKTFTIFLGTIHGSHRESKLGLKRLKKWGFAWILKKFNSGRKRVWPHTDPRSQRLVVQINQKDITGVENPSNLVCNVLKYFFQSKHRIAQRFVRSVLKSKDATSNRMCDRPSKINQ